MTKASPKTDKPRTDKQQDHCTGFGLVSTLSSDLKELLTNGLHKEFPRYIKKVNKRKCTIYDYFRHLNKDCCQNGIIDYSRVIVSKGCLEAPNITSAQLDGEGTLTLTFNNHYYHGDPNDLLILAAYYPALHACILAEPVPRSAESLTTRLPKEWLPSVPHLYAFFLGRNRYTSNSVYIPLTYTQADPINTQIDPINTKIDPINTKIDPINTPSDPIKKRIDPINDPINGPINADPITAQLYRAIRKDGTLNYAGYAKILGISETTVKRRLTALKAQGLILRSGSNKTGRWQLP